MDPGCRHWSLTEVGEAIDGTLAVGSPARCEQVPMMINLTWMMDADGDAEFCALALWDDCRAVRLFDALLHRGATLTERLIPEKSLQTNWMAEAPVKLVRRFAVPAIDFATMEQIAEQGMERILHKGKELKGLFVDGDSGVRIHYDLHYGKVLAGSREPWLVIDLKVAMDCREFGSAQLI